MKTIKVEEAKKLGYSHKNHILVSPESLTKALGVNWIEYEEHITDMQLAEFSIVKWEDDELIETEDGYWMPKIEFERISELPIKQSMRFGYINGRMDPLGEFSDPDGGMRSASRDPGYTLWVEYN